MKNELKAWTKEIGFVMHRSVHFRFELERKQRSAIALSNALK